MTRTAPLPYQRYIYANKLAWLLWVPYPSQCFHNPSYSHDSKFETHWQRWTFFKLPLCIWVSYDCNWYGFVLSFWRVYGFSLSHSSEQVSCVWSQGLQCRLLRVPFAYQSLTKSSWTGLAIRPPWIRSSQRWDMHQHTISSHQIFEPKALRDHSLSPANGVHMYIYIYIYILLGIAKEFWNHSTVSDIMTIWTGCSCNT